MTILQLRCLLGDILTELANKQAPLKIKCEVYSIAKHTKIYLNYRSNNYLKFHLNYRSNNYLNYRSNHYT